MTDSPAIRVLNDPPLDGPANMARDEALLVRVGERRSPPTLRLYQWDPPTVSLGYFQPYADYEALPPPVGQLAVAQSSRCHLAWSVTMKPRTSLAYRL